jgi:hypothetical protein
MLCSCGATRLWIGAYENHDGDASATQPVLKRKRRCTALVVTCLACPVDEVSHAAVVLLKVHQAESVERPTNVVVRLLGLPEFGQL